MHTYRALVVERWGLVVVDMIGTVATNVLGQKSSSGADGRVPLALDRLVAVQALRGSSTAGSTKELREAGTLAGLDQFWALFELGAIFFPYYKTLRSKDLKPTLEGLQLCFQGVEVQNTWLCSPQSVHIRTCIWSLAILTHQIRRNRCF